MNPQQNTTEQQQLEDLVKLIKLAREEGIPMADNDGRNDHQLACDFLLYLQYASYKLKNGWQNYNLATVTQLYEEKMKMENLSKNNIRFTCNAESSAQIDADYFDFLDYSSNDEYNQVLETNVNDGCTVLKELGLSDSTLVSTNGSTTGSSLPFQSDQNVATYCSTNANVSQDSSKYGSKIIAAFLKSDWPSDDEDETPFSTSIKERGKALYEEKRRQAEVASKSTNDLTYAQVQQALLANEINVNESFKNNGRRLTRNSVKGKRTTTTKATNLGKRSRKQIGTGRAIMTSSGSMTINHVPTTVPGLQVISPCTSLVGFSQQQTEEQERPQTPVRGTKRKVREGEVVAENPALMDFDVNKMFDDFDSAVHAAVNVTPGTMYNQLIADISPSIRDRFSANSPGQEFDDLWATYGAPVNKRLRKSSKGREWTIGFESEISEVRGVAEAGHSSYQASLDAWAASDAASGDVSQTPVEVPRTPPHQIRSATCVRTPGSAFSLSEFLNLSPSPMLDEVRLELEIGGEIMMCGFKN
ncbi:1770_t:CDS:2 [Funneliformis geosporum]|uniref:16387_t:CDS:1 n=1 Tax=Funneliformis geosporum TaxID=1117311 RepID=A0A9W4SPU1_9GLOM|nr:1770_t:CDS:2 [Funneliformis geosporum]CAI2176449.1 16387_t:CDS:2 [Funneliformis geosporum]